jgi:hypothetical protein
MTNNIYRVLKALTLCTATTVALTAQQMPKTIKEAIKGQAQVTTQVLTGTVEYVEGNNLVVRMPDGEVRHFTPPASRRFIVDGRELRTQDLKPGTNLTATVITTTTPVTERTKTIGTGTVWWVAGNTVILTLPNGENRTYKVKDDYRFVVEGKKATVADLRKGMRISAEKIVEEPVTEIASDVVVTGNAPPPPTPKPVVAQAPTPAPTRETAARTSPAPTPAPTPTPAPEPTPVSEPAPAPATLPATASNVPLAGFLGLILCIAGFSLRRFSRK